MMATRIMVYVPAQFRDKDYLGKNLYAKTTNLTGSNRIGITTQRKTTLNDNTQRIINYNK